MDMVKRCTGHVFSLHVRLNVQDKSNPVVTWVHICVEWLMEGGVWEIFSKYDSLGFPYI